ncbi:unnamed protein product, partial [Dovyalis caffra]
ENGGFHPPSKWCTTAAWWAWVHFVEGHRKKSTDGYRGMRRPYTEVGYPGSAIGSAR